MADVKIKELPTCIQREKKIGKKRNKKIEIVRNAMSSKI